MRRRHSVVSFRFRSRAARATSRNSNDAFPDRSLPAPVRSAETRFLLASVSFGHRPRLILLGRPKTAPVHSLSSAIYPRFLGDRSVDRHQFRRESCQWKMKFFFFPFFFFRDRRTRLETLEFLFGFLILFFLFLRVCGCIG